MVSKHSVDVTYANKQVSIDKLVQFNTKFSYTIKWNRSGMLMKAIEWGSKRDEIDTTCKFVIVEPLGDSTPNQLTRFLQANAGPGIQHLAFGVSNICQAVNYCRAGGIDFVQAPRTYYDEIVDSCKTQDLPVDLTDLVDSGILIDMELRGKFESQREDPSCLLQVFTEPIFKQDALFFELIERRNGAYGFGNANITALWRALERDQLEKNKHALA